MRKWIRRIVVLSALLATLLLLWQSWSGPRIASGSFVVFQIEGAYPESPPEGVLRRIVLPRERSLIELLLDLRKAAADERVRGIVFRIGRTEIGWGKAAEIRAALLAFRKSGKLSVALIEQELTSSNIAHYIASACDRVYVSAASNAPLAGLSAQYLFLGGLWEKLDVELTVEKRSEYKTAGDMLAGHAMTPAHREMANSLLDDLSGELFQALALSRSLTSERVRELVEEEGPSSPEQLLQAGFIDGIEYWEDVQQELGGPEAYFVDEATYRSVPAERVGLQKGPSLGVVLAAGQIVTGESRTTPTGMLLGAETIRKALKAAASNDAIRAIVLRIDSPGGSALASDTIWRAVREASKRKPVVVSMSDYAASGGYYSAVAANKIVAQPTTLTGSIGVVLARPNVRGLLQRFGIQTETLTRGRFAALDDPTTPLDEAGRARLSQEVDRVYQLFLQRVAEGRSLPREDVESVARGRVWTGNQALERRLVDRLGGFWAAVDLAKELAGIPASTEVKLEFFPPPRGWLAEIEESVSWQAGANFPAHLREALRWVPLVERSGPLLYTPLLVDVR